MAPPARLELTTLRLGGVRSIQVSYGGICISIVLKKTGTVNQNLAHFAQSGAYTIQDIWKGAQAMGNQEMEFDKLLYEEGSGKPSER